MKTKRNGINGILATVALFFVFALISLAVLIVGARSYRGVTARMEKTDSSRTALAYIANKVRQNGGSGGVSVRNVEGIPVLALRQTVGDSVYETLIFYQEGAVRELLVPAGTDKLTGGLEIVPALGLHFVLTDGSLSVELSDSGGDEIELTLHLRS